MKYLFLSVLIASLVGVMFISNAFGEYVPDWVKNTAGWWADDKISETEFVNAVEFLVKENIIQVNLSQTSETSQGVPGWVKNTAGWWATDVISESEFVNAIAFLIENGIVMISSLDEKYNLCSDTDVFSTEIRKQAKLEIKEEWNQLCYDFYDDSYAGYVAVEKKESVHLNSHGFRGQEITKEKPDNTYRIFTVGGSTTHGLPLVTDNETWSYYLQKKFDEKDFGFDIEVINAGMAAATSKTEVQLVKNKLIDFSPDLIVVFDGINDAAWVANPNHPDWESQSEISWKDRWTEICNIGKKNGFDTIVTLQPFYKSGFQVLTENDYQIYREISVIAKDGFVGRMDTYPSYLNQLPDLNKNCTKAVDMSRIFDKIPVNLFVVNDSGHVGSVGNKIIAENFYQIILPIVSETQYFESTGSIISKKVVTDLLSLENLNFNSVNFENLNLSGIDFSGRNLVNAIFYNTNLDNVDFTNANLEGVNFAGANLEGANFTGANIENANFMKTKLGNANFSGAVLNETIFSWVDFSRTDLSNASMMDTKIFESSFNGMNLTGISFIGTDLSNSNLSDADLSGNDLTRTILTGVDLSNSNLTGIDLTGLDLTRAILVGVDLSSKDLSRTIFDHASFADANLENANLTEASFVDIDLTKIKNKSLTGSDLSNTSFANSNLSGVDLSGTLLQAPNFWKTNLSGVDFTVVDFITDGAIFIDANLSNSNFEDVDLSPKKQFSSIFEDKAYLYDLPRSMITEELFGEFNNVLIISQQVQGNDLAVEYFFYHSFASANLENANF